MLLQILIAVVVVTVLWLVLLYNGLVKLRQHVRESWSDIDTELKRRYDLIPNLVETVKGYAEHERGLFDAVTDARARAMASQGSPRSQARDEEPLVQQTRRLIAVAERYPDLRASENFLALQQQLVETEDRIQAARRFYNGNVRDFNTRQQSFPANLVAGPFGFHPAEYFEVDRAVVREVVDVTFAADPGE